MRLWHLWVLVAAVTALVWYAIANKTSGPIVIGMPDSSKADIEFEQRRSLQKECMKRREAQIAEYLEQSQKSFWMGEGHVGLNVEQCDYE